MPTNDKAPHAGWVKLEDLAAKWGPMSKSEKGVLFSLSSRQYRNIAKEGYASQPERGYVNPLTAMAQMLAYYQGMAEGKGDSTHEEEKKLKTREERLIKEMERKKMAEELIERSAVAEELVKRVHVLKGDLLSLPKRLAKYPEAKEITEKQVRHIMRVYSRRVGVFCD